MIKRVYEQASLCKELSDVIVATDDERIFSHVKEFGGKVVMTSTEHPSGTDRCLEAYKNYGKQADAIVNIQGDEPFIQPAQIELICSCFLRSGVEIATLVKKINSTEELFNENTPKVILNKEKQAVYFSRQTIPFLRNVEKDEWINKHVYYKHIGMYAYRADILEQLTALKPSALEIAESLEQLRWLENGYRITAEITRIESQSVDVPSDLDKLKF